MFDHQLLILLQEEAQKPSSLSRKPENGLQWEGWSNFREFIDSIEMQKKGTLHSGPF